MENANPFEDAVDEALRQSDEHDAAVSLVESLTEQLSDAVFRKTGGKVRIELIAEAQALTLGSVLSSLRNAAGPSIGTDREDRVERQYVVAKGGTESRALWAVTYSEAGFPVTLRGPQPDASTTCFSDRDLVEEFLGAVRHGRVGRKIANLAKEQPDSGAPLLENREATHSEETATKPQDE